MAARPLRHAVLRGALTAAGLGVLGVLVWALGQSPLLVMTSFALGAGAVVTVAGWLEARWTRTEAASLAIGAVTAVATVAAVLQAHFAGVWLIADLDTALASLERRLPLVLPLAVPIAVGAGVAHGLASCGDLRRDQRVARALVAVAAVLGVLTLTVEAHALLFTLLFSTSLLTVLLLVPLVAGRAAALEARLWPE